MAIVVPHAPAAIPRQPAAPGALDLLEEAVHLLRRAPVGTLACYYGATLPFVLGLLFFWADLSRDPEAESLAPWAALGLVVLFLGMKTGQAVFASQLRAGLLGTGGERPWTAGRLWRLFLVQATLQPSGFVLLPLAAVATLPFAWVYAFYQHLTTAGDEANGSVRAALAHAGRLSRPWARQNHTALGVLSLLAVIVWVDGLIAALLLPQLAKVFTGVESIFTRSGTGVLFNTTFLLASFALAYAALDPLVKAFYVLRGFYADARRTGEDLRREVRALPAVPTMTPRAGANPAAALAAAAVRLWLLTALLVPAGVRAQSSAPAAAPPAPAANPAVAPGGLDRSIEDVIRRREFAWRLPRGEARSVQATKKPDGPFVRWLKGVSRSIDRFMSWLRRLLRKERKDVADEPVRPVEPREWLGGLLQLAAWVLIGLGAVAGVVLYLRARRARQADPAAGAGAAAADVGPDPDAAELADEALLPTRLPEDEWLRLGRELRAKGETRLALRAFYLSVLAGLAARELVAVARHKSNGDYLAEVRRRGRDRAGLPEGFSAVVGLFERPWYGRHAADEGTLDALLVRREEVLANAGALAPPVPPVAPLPA